GPMKQRRAWLLVTMTAMLAPLPARAQDADGDGVVDRSDRCPLTPPGAPVDPAGCASVCDAQVVGTDGFARTLLTEIGLNVMGAFGSAGAAPSGYHPRASGGSPPSPRLGFVANPERDGWVDYDGDYFLPGTPEEGWGITVAGVS